MAYLQLAAAELLTDLQPGVHRSLQVPLQAPAKVPEHGGTSGQNHVLQDKQRMKQHRLFGSSGIYGCLLGSELSLPCREDVERRWGSSG